MEYEELTKRTYLNLPGQTQKWENPNHYLSLRKQNNRVEYGVIHNFVYPVEGGGFLEVATTRPETMLGDTAVAIHPDDERFKVATFIS